MFANFIKETCTGTGDTLSLAGEETGFIPFDAYYADGEPVPYIVKDGNGTNKVAGYGTFNTGSPDTITRNDLWTWNGTVVDKNPSANLTLSGGTHEILVGPMAEIGYGGITPPNTLGGTFYNVPDNIFNQNGTDTISNADREWFGDAIFHGRTVITSRYLRIETADAACTNFRLGIYAQNPTTGRPGKLLEDSGDQSANVATTGDKEWTLSAPLVLNPGRYYFSIVTDSTTVEFKCPAYDDRIMSGGGLERSNNNHQSIFYANGVTGALASNPTISGALITFGAVPMGYR